MKLYFYFLKESEKEKSCIYLEECEAREAEKTYISVSDSFPKIIRKTIRKDEIGKPIRYYGNVVVFTEKNSEKVADVFKRMFTASIEKANSDIEYAKERIRENTMLIEMVEKWRTVNETN